MRILLIGGSKSGKSLLAQQLCLRLSGGGRRVYWATMEPVDGEDRARIARHLRERDGWGFETVECGRAILRAADRAIGATVLFDSATALLACEMFSAAGFDPEAGTRAAEELLVLSRRADHFVCVCDDLFRDGDLRGMDGALPPRIGPGLPPPGRGIRHGVRGDGGHPALL